MMHMRRRWGVGPVATPEELAKNLTECTWTLCTGFYVHGHDDYLFVNDATHEDGAAEYAVYGSVVVMWSWSNFTWNWPQIRAFIATYRW